MIVNDLKTKVDGKFYREVTIEDDGEDIIYVFPDTKEFLSIIRRKEISQKLKKMKIKD
ncbi:MAG: hypothetical protein ACFFB0_18575 [Promethearchaeota archaeon]